MVCPDFPATQPEHPLLVKKGYLACQKQCTSLNQELLRVNRAGNFVMLTVGTRLVCTKLEEELDVNKISVGPESLDRYATYLHTDTDQSKIFIYDNICKNSKIIKKMIHCALMSMN